MRRNLVTLSLALGLAAHAQLPLVDITSVQTINDQVEIFIRPDGFFDGYFSGMVFTVRWFEADGANLGSTQQILSQEGYMGSVVKSGPEQVDGPFRYQIYFVNETFQTLASVGASWNDGEELLLCRLNIINGGSYFTIVNDTWTNANNGSFFVSLNGLNRTGEIYTFTTAVDEGTALPTVARIAPNPTSGPVDLFHSAEGVVRCEVFDAAGQLILTNSWSSTEGSVRRLDLGGLADGLYSLRLDEAGRISTHRVVLQR